MTISYHVDAGSMGRRDTRNVFPTPELAIENASTHARRLNRAVSVFEVDSERTAEWGEGTPAAKAHYCLVWPDGSTQKSVDGQNPFKVFLDEHATSGSDDEDSVEKTLGLPTISLGSAVGKLDNTILQLRDHPDNMLIDRLHRISGELAEKLETLATRNKNVVQAFKVGQTCSFAGGTATIMGVNTEHGVITVAGAESEFEIEALELAQMIIADQQAEAHHLTPGDVAVLDEKDRVFVLDSADEVYVVMQDGAIKTVPDDVTRIRRAEDAGDNEAKKVKRVWQTFYRALLKFFDVESIDQLDSEGKSRAFDMARRKWPKVQRQMLEKEDPEEENEEAPQSQEAPTAPQQAPQNQPQASAESEESDEDKKDEDSEEKEEDEPDADDKPQKKWNFESSWSASPTLLSYCMDILRNDVEASTKLALSFMTATIRDATKLRAMKQMTRFEGHDLPSDWFTLASLLAEVSKRSSVKASKAIDLTPPKEVQKIAARALDKASKTGILLPAITAQHAKLLTSGRALSLEAAERMHLFLTRHNVTAQSELLWDAWGGHPGKRWVAKLATMIGQQRNTGR